MSINADLFTEDLYMAVNGDWQETAEIPDDKASTGGFNDLRDGIEELLMGVIQGMEAGELAIPNDELDEMLTYYRQAIDFDERNTLAGEPLKPYLQQIESLNDYAALEELFPAWVLRGFPLPFTFGVSADMKNTAVHTLYLGVPSTILPDVTYYEAGNESAEALLAIYQQMSVEILEAIGYDYTQAQSYVEQALAFDRLLVPHLKSQEELADYVASYNPRSMAEIESYHSRMSFKKIIQALLGQEISEAIVSEPAYFEALERILTPEHFSQLKAWMLVKLANSQASMMSEDLRQLAGQYSLALSGNPSIQNQTKHAYYLTTSYFDMVIGDYYGKTYFGPEARQDVREMVEVMINVYKERLKRNDWLSQATINQAIVKLDALDILVGYPDDYPDVYRAIDIQPDKSLYENTLAMRILFAEDALGKYGEPVDRKKWGMSPDTVNAYFNPAHNHICFPAAILQAPFYSLEQSRSENYGGIGAVIAHEISHAFDNNGAKFDEYGNLNNWWTDEDFEAFETKADAMVKQWDGIEYAGGKVNGTLTVSENIADGGGLTAALEATKRETDGDLRAFFINWARIWRNKARPEYMQLLLTVDVHAPAPLRASVQPRNLDEFHEVFGTQVGDGMYLAPEDRVIIW
ncbi:peptidase M13 [Suicoccus acidiformans]|uniref:Peptidase M13 n=1 Tax=Suicoccus acidiformans TaxID=2036206 RepID=A0A347WHL9_9LACT|nr:M13 family metallopeptidase [Suicoccus acidiformans]AXY24576.1 peptidase M13 [Suicoccus acidiformans]